MNFIRYLKLVKLKVGEGFFKLYSSINKAIEGLRVKHNNIYNKNKQYLTK